MLSLVGASKAFDGAVAVRPMDLQIEPGRTTVLIGPSGSGKSTILRMMTGLVRPDAGEVRFDGEAITRRNLSDVRLRMGYVIQEGGLFPHMTSWQNVTVVARYLKWRLSDLSARVRDLCELTQLPAALLDRYPAQLSGGQRQRVSLMRALMLDPGVLLFDEPLGALDPMIRHDLQRDLKRIFQHLGKTVVLVTHDLGEAAFFADTIVLMRAGEIIQRGTLQDLITHPADSFVVQFVSAQRSPLDTAVAPI